MLSQTRRTQERAARHVAPIFTCALALAAVVGFTRPAAAQIGTNCGGEAVILCGTVWNDLNGNGVQDAGEPGIEGVPVLVYDGTNIYEQTTDSLGNYFFDSQTLMPNSNITYSVSIETAAIGTGVQPSPTDSPLGNDGNDSDGVDDTSGRSIFYPLVITDLTVHDVDFGFAPSGAKNPGTGTPGYWKNHPTAWPVSSITIGGVLYSRDEAIAILTKPGKDKRATMFSSLLSAMLNVMIGNDNSCVQTTIDAANDWMATWGIPNQGTIVAGGSAAWTVGEPLHKQMDAYNNGLLCAPHRN